MGCCIALALVISVVRTGWFRLVRRQAPPRAGFAPPARRPAPSPAIAATADPVTSPRSPWPLSDQAAHSVDGDLGEIVRAVSSRTSARGAATAAAPAPAETSAPARRPLGPGRLGPAVAVVALAAVIGVGVYSVLLAVLAHTGLVTVDLATADRGHWRVRGLVLIAGGVAAGLVALRSGLHRVPPAERGRRPALALAGAGGAWSLLSVVDMHLTGLIPETLVDPIVDLVLHGPGFLAATTGVGALLAGDRWMNSLSPSTRGESS